MCKYLSFHKTLAQTLLKKEFDIPTCTCIPETVRKQNVWMHIGLILSIIMTRIWGLIGWCLVRVHFLLCIIYISNISNDSFVPLVFGILNYMYSVLAEDRTPYMYKKLILIFRYRFMYLAQDKQSLEIWLASTVTMIWVNIDFYLDWMWPAMIISAWLNMVLDRATAFLSFYLRAWVPALLGRGRQRDLTLQVLTWPIINTTTEIPREPACLLCPTMSRQAFTSM